MRIPCGLEIGLVTEVPAIVRSKMATAMAALAAAGSPG